MKRGGIIAEAMRMFRPDRLDSLILFVTNSCNLCCGFCCYAENLNVSKDISLEDMRKISGSVGKFRALLVSGGEPFIRADLDEVLLLFARNNGINSINIPTNGWYLERTERTCRSFLEQNREVMLNLSFSVDGPQEVHDRIRQRAGTFEHLCKTIEFLSPWRSRYPNLRLRVNSVVTPDNIGTIRSTIDYFHGRFDLDEHALEMVRDLGVLGAHHDSIERRAISGRYLELVDYAYDLYARSKPRRRGQLGRLPEPLSNLLSYAFNRATARVKHDRIMGRLWPFPCTAGRAIMVINGSGSLRACEHRGEVVDLRQHQFDVGAALATPAMREECQRIAGDRCDCLHGCFVGNSLQHSPPAVLTRILPPAMRRLFCRR